MKVKIISDGTSENTKIVNAETEEEIEDIIHVEVSIDAFNVEAAFLVKNPKLEMQNVSAQEVSVGDHAIQYDGGTSTSDN
tara:strand:- start:31559 stop:31798 length:240 start_codon:yes stop_codon:yes gene_type:complete